MSIQAAKEELNFLTTFQKEIHVVSDLSEEIISNFYRAFIKSTWFSSIPMKLKCSPDGDEVVYSVNNSFHLLMYTYMTFNLPAIKVKSEFHKRVRIAWCHNPGTNITQRASFKDDDDTYHSWDSVWADIYFQFFQDPGAGKRDNHNIGIGNVPCLENWSELLPSYPINVDQPWFYSMYPALAFPIFYKNSQTRAEHRYSFRKILDLLRVQILNRDKKWVNTTRGVAKYIEFAPAALDKNPELWGRYAYITESEIKWYKCKQTRTFYIRDVESCDSPNPNKYLSTSEVPLTCTNPCLSFFWVAENADSTAVHNYSNYTTNTADLYSGWDPIRTNTLKYGTINRLNNMPSHHFSIAEPRKHFRSAPSERGYHGCSLAWDSTSFDGDTGVIFAGRAHFQCKIANNNIYLSTALNEEEEDDEDLDIDMAAAAPGDHDHEEELAPGASALITAAPVEVSPNFITRVRLYVMRKFTVTAEGEDDRRTYKFTIL